MSLHIASSSSPVGPRHVDDGDLLRLEDGELGSDERESVTLHLAACVPCSVRRDALVAIAARLGAAHQRVTLPAALVLPPWHHAPARQRAQPRVHRTSSVRGTRGRAIATALRAAVAVTLLGGAAAAATPLRSWISQRMAATKATGSVLSPANEDPVVGVSVPALHMGDVAFVPASSTLTIGLEGRAGDSIEVRTTASETARVRGRTSGGEPTVIVLPDRVRLISPREGPSTYSIEVPPTVRVVEVRTGTGLLTRLTRASLDTAGAWGTRLP